MSNDDKGRGKTELAAGLIFLMLVAFWMEHGCPGAAAYEGLTSKGRPYYAGGFDPHSNGGNYKVLVVGSDADFTKRSYWVLVASDFPWYFDETRRDVYLQMESYVNGTLDAMFVGTPSDWAIMQQKRRSPKDPDFKEGGGQ